jgi:hypothetical protein
VLELIDDDWKDNLSLTYGLYQSKSLLFSRKSAC